MHVFVQLVTPENAFQMVVSFDVVVLLLLLLLAVLLPAWLFKIILLEDEVKVLSVVNMSMGDMLKRGFKCLLVRV